MYETVKEVGEETIKNKNITLLSRDHNTSLQSDNVQDIGDINNELIIEEEVTKKYTTIGQLKDDSVYLQKNAKHILHEIPLGILWMMIP